MQPSRTANSFKVRLEQFNLIVVFKSYRDTFSIIRTALAEGLPNKQLYYHLKGFVYKTYVALAFRFEVTLNNYFYQSRVKTSDLFL